MFSIFVAMLFTVTYILFYKYFVRASLQLANQLLKPFLKQSSFVIFPNYCHYELKLYHQQKLWLS